MQVARDEFLAGAGLAGDQYAGIARRDLLDLGEQCLGARVSEIHSSGAFGRRRGGGGGQTGRVAMRAASQE